MRVDPIKRVGIHGGPPRIWTEPEDEVLIRMWNEGDLIKLIANQLNRGEKSISERRIRLRLPRRSGYQRKPGRMIKQPKIQRKCLRCLQQFGSDWVGNRLCTACKSRKTTWLEITQHF